jgi:predicted ester cyclase
MTNSADVLRTAREAWNAGDLAGYLSMYDESIRLHGYTPRAMNKEEVRSFYEALFAAFADVRLEFHEELWEGDRVAIRFTMTGRHVGEFMGVTATERDVALPGFTIIHFMDGKAIERWSLTDTFGLLVQLGALPPPG